jgi:ribose transport system substrate-binding protein
MKAMSARLGAVALVSVAALALAGCSKAGDSAPASTAGANTPITIGVVITGIALYPYYQAEVKGIKAEAAKLGKDIKLVVLDSQGSDQTEQSNMQQVINEKVNAIIYTPGSDAVGAAETAAATAAGIPVIAVDRTAGKSESAYVGYDNVALGEDMANYAVAQLGGKGNIGGEIGVPGVINVINREKGWKNVLAKNPNVNYVGEVTTNFDPSVAYTVTQNLITGHPNTQWILVMDDNTALGTIRAVKDSGKDIKVMGLGGQTAGFKAVEDGSMAATVLMKPYELGSVGLKTAVQVARGQKFDKAPTFTNPVVTKSNAAKYLKETGVGW